MLVAHTLNPSTQEVETVRSLSSRPDLSRVSFRMARIAQRNPAWNKPKQQDFPSMNPSDGRYFYIKLCVCGTQTFTDNK